MSHAAPFPPPSAFHLFRPPYRELSALRGPVGLSGAVGLTGAALVWTMAAGRNDEELRVARHRPGGLALLVVLPPADTVSRKDEIFRMIEFCRPAAVMPFHEEPHVDDLETLLGAPPEDLPAAVVDYLRWRGVPLEMDIRRLVRRTLELSNDLRSVNALARGVYLSRRALGRRFTRNGLPVPSHWLHVARVLRAAIKLQEPDARLARIAYDLGYPDGFALSNQMKRLTGVRPSDVRRRRGWEWLLETWIRKEATEGGFGDEVARLILSGEESPLGLRGRTAGSAIPAPGSTSRVRDREVDALPRG